MAEVPLVSIIDNSDSVGWAVAAVIGSSGFRALVFPSAEEFIQSDQMSCTACLIVEVQLPGMSGLQLQSHLASTGRHIPMIFIAASAHQADQKLAFELGAISLRDKPSGDRALLQAIRLILKPGDKG
ncbi:MAG: response regulator [Candidatus Sulfotelmatobacter sp.]